MAAEISVDTLDERTRDQGRRITAIEEEQAVLHNRITKETESRLCADSARAWQFVTILIGIVVTIVLQLIKG
jgi:hypothetical protein